MQVAQGLFWSFLVLSVLCVLVHKNFRGSDLWYWEGITHSSTHRSLQTSTLVSYGEDNKLVYGGYKNTISHYFKGLDATADVAGGTTNTVPDFSNVGYKGGDEPIPFVPAVITLMPSGGNDAPRIQEAIDNLSSLPLGTNGFRGAILLKAGRYDVADELRISSSGIVLRGEGSGTTAGNTVIIYSKRVQSNMISVRGSTGPTVVGETFRVTDSFVPTGSKTFNVSVNHRFVVGSKIMVELTSNDDWLLHMSNMAQWGWALRDYQLRWKRVVTAVDGSHITIHAPLVQAIDSVYGGANVFEYNYDGAISNIGFENMRLESSFASNTDEDHGWVAIRMDRVVNSWMRQITGRYWGYGLVQIRSESSQITVEDCAMLNHKSVITGSRRYSFSVDQSDFVLLQRCLTRDGRHDFVTGARTPGPNVWVDSLALNAYSDIGPHHRYATGLLFDNVRSRSSTGGRGDINVQNRADMGSGHGWAGAQTMFWNNEGNIICDAPNGAMNWAIGTVGTYKNSQQFEPDGFLESLGTHVTPRSLYYSQLQDRLGANGLRYAVLPQQKEGYLYSQLEAWNGEGLFLDPVVTWLDENSVPIAPEETLPIGGIVRDLSLLDAPLTLYQWSQVSGPGVATFEDATSRETTVSFSAEGYYVLMLVVASSTGAGATASLSVFVSSPITENEITVLPTEAPITVAPRLSPFLAPSSYPTQAPGTTNPPTTSPLVPTTAPTAFFNSSMTQDVLESLAYTGVKERPDGADKDSYKQTADDRCRGCLNRRGLRG